MAEINPDWTWNELEDYAHSVEDERDCFAQMLRGVIDQHDGVSKMEGRDYDAIRAALDDYRSPLLSSGDD